MAWGCEEGASPTGTRVVGEIKLLYSPNFYAEVLKILLSLQEKYTFHTYQNAQDLEK